MKKVTALSAAAALAATALVPAATVSANVEETALSHVVFTTTEGQLVSLSMEQYNGALVAGVLTAQPTHVQLANGKTYTMEQYNGALVATDGSVEDATALLDEKSQTVANEVLDGKVVDGKVVPKDASTETPAGDLQVESVKAINSTQLLVTFNEKVDKKTAENLNNYYIGLTANKVEDESIAKLNGDNYKAVLQADGKSVLISGKDEKQVIWKDKNTADEASALKVDAKTPNAGEVVKNKTVFVQVRNVKDASGKLMDTQEVSFKAEDKVAPTNGTAEVKYANKGEKADKVEITFNEPIVLVKVKDEDEEEKIKTTLYFDSKTVEVTDNMLSNDGRTLTLEHGKTKLKDNEGTLNLSEGKHEIEIVGIEDLAGNRIVGDMHTYEINVAPEKQEAVQIVPEALKVEQLHDGAFAVYFNTKVTGAEVTVKKLVADQDVTFNFEAKKLKKYGELYKYTVDFADATTEEGKVAQNVAANWKDVYKTSTEIIRDVEVKNIKTAQKEGKDKVFKSEVFQLDNLAPVVKGNVAVSENRKNISVEFTDQPFDGEVILNTEENLANIKPIVIKQLIDGETKTIEIPATAVKDLFENNTLKITAAKLKDIDKEAYNKMTKAGALLPGEYTLILPKGLVTDGEVLEDGDETPQFKFQSEFIGSTETFTVKEDGTEENVSVPQTAQNLVKYSEGQDVIEVEFKGADIDPKTVTNAANYTLAGKALDAKNIEFERVLDKKGNETGAIARIFLNDNTIVRDGSYTLTVMGVATKGGAKMLPTSVTVDGMKDNTLPVAKTATITGNGQIEVTFSESVKVTDSRAGENFEVLINNVPFTVASVTELSSNDKVLVIHTDGTFDMNAGYTVQVKTKKNVSGDVFVTDLGGNKMAIGTAMTATKK